jgi:hypothetical protein
MKFICGNFALGLVLALRAASSHATVFELPADGSAVIGADTVVSTHLLLEAHPPVDAQDYAREVLQKADGVIATVGLEADD